MAFFPFYNNGLALSYPKMQFWGQNWTKTWFEADPVGGHFDFMSLRQMLQVNWKHQSIPFSVLYNNGLALSYQKMQFLGRNWTKTWFDADPVGGHFDFMSLGQMVLMNYKHESIPFSVHCNSVLTLQYGKRQAGVEKPQLRPPSWILPIWRTFATFSAIPPSAVF